MTKTELREIPLGATFQAFGEIFIALDNVDGGILSIRKEPWKQAAFDHDGRNDLRCASIGETLATYENILQDGGAKQEDLLTMKILLQATDNAQNYGERPGKSRTASGLCYPTAIQAMQT